MFICMRFAADFGTHEDAVDDDDDEDDDDDYGGQLVIESDPEPDAIDA